MASQAQGLANAFPKDKALLNLLGSVFNQLNQAQAAITLLSGALRLDMFFIDAQFNLDIAHQKNKIWKTRLPAFKTLSSLRQIPARHILNWPKLLGQILNFKQRFCIIKKRLL